LCAEFDILFRYVDNNQAFVLLIYFIVWCHKFAGGSYSY